MAFQFEYSTIRVCLFLIHESVVLLRTIKGNPDGGFDYLPIIGYVKTTEEVIGTVRRLSKDIFGMEIAANIDIFGLLHDEEEAMLTFFVAGIIPLRLLGAERANSSTAWFNIDRIPNLLDNKAKSALVGYRRGVRFNSLEDISYRE